MAAQRGDLRVQPGHQIFESRQIGFGGAQLLFSIAPSYMQARNAGGVLQHGPAFGRFGGNDGSDSTLANERGRMRARCCIGKDQPDILGPDIAAIHPIGRARAALDAADDFKVIPYVALAGLRC